MFMLQQIASPYHFHGAGKKTCPFFKTNHNMQKKKENLRWNFEFH